MGESVVKTWTEQLFSITEAAGEQVAVISKEIFHMTDTYVFDIVNPVNALRVARTAEIRGQDPVKTGHDLRFVSGRSVSDTEYGPVRGLTTEN